LPHLTPCTHRTHLTHLVQEQYRNLLVQAEVAELRSRAGELPASERTGLMQRVETAERAAMAERLETSYKQIRDYQETLHQSQEQMEGAQAILDTSQDKYFSLCRKYDQAKRLIADLRQAESVLTEQLLTREEQYALHLVRCLTPDNLSPYLTVETNP